MSGLQVGHILVIFLTKRTASSLVPPQIIYLLVKITLQICSGGYSKWEAGSALLPDQANFGMC